MFSFYNRHNNNLYNKLVEFSRNIFFYKDLNLKDNFETRIILIFLHFSIILLKYRKVNKEKFPQEIFDNIFVNIEYHLRELGYGDVAVNKKMKILNRFFYDILLKIDKSKDSNLIINKSVLKEHLFQEDQVKDVYIDKLTNYFESFYNFCFEIKDKNMIKGLINFKYY
tara:strand:- start:86 stop:589 length:504 start_codon:yes stop_codon:yes gene_type:complete